MCSAIALAASELPAALIKRHRLAERYYDREGKPEFRFHWWEQPTLLPVRWGGRLDILPWGSKLRRGPLPYGGWVSAEHVAAGVLGEVEEAVIPATFGQARGVWFVVIEGIRAAVVRTPAPVVFMLTEPATNYWRNMTEQSAVMPVFVNQVI